jgi:hypothetical protein
MRKSAQPQERRGTTRGGSPATRRRERWIGRTWRCSLSECPQAEHGPHGQIGARAIARRLVFGRGALGCRWRHGRQRSGALEAPLRSSGRRPRRTETAIRSDRRGTHPWRGWRDRTHDARGLDRSHAGGLRAWGRGTGQRPHRRVLRWPRGSPPEPGMHRQHRGRREGGRGSTWALTSLFENAIDLCALCGRKLLFGLPG